MMAKKPAVKSDDGPAKKLAELGLERFEIEEVHRSQLKGAPYNPRKLGDEEKKKLKAGLARHGLVAPITWNRRSGNIVGGHQRLSQLDALAGTSNYTLKVAVIDVDDIKEKELNILLNNPNAQGEWDLELLGNLLKDERLDLKATGFDDADVFRLFGDTVKRQDDENAISDLSEQLQTLQEKFKSIKGKGLTDDFYVVVVFRDYDDCSLFLQQAGLPEERYQSGADFRRLMKIDVDDPPKDQILDADVPEEQEEIEGDDLEASLKRMASGQ
jgi:hypothetical protein